MRSDDYTFCTYRGHNHTLARGVPMAPILAELFGRGTGLLGGKGGSMHLTSVEHGVMGSYAIVGAHLPIALGAAWSAQYRGTGQVAVCFFGDGTTNIGAFHEALNMAAVWKAPVVFVCENNQYMEYTPIGAVTAVPRPGGRPGERLRPRADRRRRQRPRRGVGRRDRGDPARAGRGGAVADRGPDLPPRRPLARRSRQVPPGRRGQGVDGTRPAPALPRAAARDGRDEATLAAIEAETRDKVAAAEQEAREAPEPDPAVLETQVWADGGSSWRGDGRDGADLPRGRRRGHRPEMDRDASVVLIGEDVGAAGGVFKLTEGLFARFGDEARPRHADQRAGDRRAPRWAPR